MSSCMRGQAIWQTVKATIQRPCRRMGSSWQHKTGNADLAKNLERLQAYAKASNMQLPTKLRARPNPGPAPSGALAAGACALFLAGSGISYINSQVGESQVPALVQAKKIMQRFNSSGIPATA